VPNLYQRLAVGKTIEQSGDAFVVDGNQRWRVTSSSTKPIIRRSGDVQELLVPIEFKQTTAGNTADLEIELTW
jgi:hypothetical protein